VTGASSGIGAAIVNKLASQNINVVLVALDDNFLNEFYPDVCARFPQIEFRRVGVDLSRGDYMTPIIQATADLEISLVFNNAGYVLTGFFADLPLERNLCNAECNAMAALKITHHFLNLLLSRKSGGLIAFTSSSSFFLPNPLSALYAATKAFMTNFAASLASEVKAAGVDVCVIHPSPVETGFFNNANGMQALLSFKRFAVSPDLVAETLFASVGRCVVRDQGLVSILFRLLMKAIDFNILADWMPMLAHLMPDYQTFLAKRKLDKSK